MGMEDRSAATDAYEAKYMPGDGKVLHRSKVVSRFLASILLGFGVMSGVGGALSFVGAPAFVPWLLFAMSLFFIFLGLSLSVLRTVVTTELIHVQYGLWGPRVPIEQITGCSVVKYDWVKFGGWGLKRAADGTWAYTLKNEDEVVSLSWKDDDGEERTAVFSAEEPIDVVAEVNRARALRRDKARVDTSEPADAALDPALEAEVEAMAAEELAADEKRSEGRE